MGRFAARRRVAAFRPCEDAWRDRAAFTSRSCPTAHAVRAGTSRWVSSYLAAKTGMPIIVCGIGYDRPWRLKTWDRFALPRPFSKARIVTFDPIHVPADVAKDKMEGYRQHVQAELERACEMAEKWANPQMVSRDAPVEPRVPLRVPLEKPSKNLTPRGEALRTPRFAGKPARTEHLMLPPPLTEEEYLARKSEATRLPSWARSRD